MGSAHKNLILSELLPTVFGQLEMLYGESRLGGAIWGIPAKTWSRHRVWMAGPDYVNQDDREVRIVFRVKFVAKAAGMLAAVAFSVALLASPIHAGEQAHGQGSYLLGPGMPTVFSFDRQSMSCSVAWGTLAAPGPGPVTDPKMGLENANFGMIVFSLSVTDFRVVGDRVTMKGKARSLTTVNENLVENAVYDYTVEAVDGGALENDRFSMTLQGEGLMFDGHTFAPQEGAGLVSGDIVISQ